MAKFTRREKNRPVPKLAPRIAGLMALVVAVLITASRCGCTTCRSSGITNSSNWPTATASESSGCRRCAGWSSIVHHRPLVDTRPSFDAVMVPEDAPNVNQTIARLEKSARSERHRQKNRTMPKTRAPAIRAGDGRGAAGLAASGRPGDPSTGASGGEPAGDSAAPLHLYDSLAAHLLGYVGEVDGQGPQPAASDYRMGDDIGKFGLERSWESSCAAIAAGRRSRSIRSAGASSCCARFRNGPATAW